MKRKIGAALVVVAVLAAGFYLLSFRVMSSQMARDAQVLTARSGDENGPAPQPTGLRVEGDSRIAQALQAGLADNGQIPGLGSVVLLKGGEDQSAPVLVVRFKQCEIGWTPVHARSVLEVEVAYASNGDTSFREMEPPSFRPGSTGSGFQLLGHYTAADISWGLVSRPGYEDYLGAQLAETLRASLQQQFKS